MPPDGYDVITVDNEVAQLLQEQSGSQSVNAYLKDLLTQSQGHRSPNDELEERLQRIENMLTDDVPEVTATKVERRISDRLR